MHTKSILIASLLVVTSTNLWANSAASTYSKICTSCHGDNACGKSKISSKSPLLNFKGPALNHLSQEELLVKLKNLRKNIEGRSDKHLVMKKNLQDYEKLQGKVSDEEMAKYIYNSFGKGSK